MNAEGRAKGKRSWKKAVLLSLLLLTAAPICGWFWWGHSADKELNTLIASIRARGEPLEWSELAPPAVADEQNAAELYKKALSVPLPASTLSTSDAAQALQKASKALALCRTARTMTEVDWKMDFSGPAMEAAIPPVSKIRSLGKTLCIAAIAAHEGRNDAACVEYLADALHLADALDSAPHLVCHIGALSIDDAVCQAIEQVSPRLKIGGDTGCATANTVTLFAASLANTTVRQSGLVRAWIGERAIAYDTFKRLWQGNIKTDSYTTGASESYGRAGIALSTLTPALKADAVFLMRWIDSFVQGSSESSYHACVAKSRSITAPWQEEYDAVFIYDKPGKIGLLKHTVSRIIQPSFPCRSHFRALAMRRMAAISLAIRRYEVEHGRRPTTLSELVPQYLGAIPIDPFAKDASPLRYTIRNGEPLLYSVNTDGEDDGGDFAIVDAAVMRSADLPFFLDGNRHPDLGPVKPPGLSPRTRPSH